MLEREPVDYAALDELGVTRHCTTLPDGSVQEFFIVGTAHVSDESCNDVRAAVRAVHPDCLIVELCPQRAGLLFPPEKVASDEGTGAVEQIKQTMKERQGLSGVFQLLLTYLYKKVGSEINIQSGAEFRAALDEVRLSGQPCRLVLGDRAIGVTIQRAWALLPLGEKVTLCWELVKAMLTSITKEDIERMKRTDVLESLMMEFSSKFPSLAKVLLAERDLYLARSLHEMRDSRVLAVVGLGHVKGMVETLQRWGEDPSLSRQECKHLLTVPPTPWTTRRMLLLFLLFFVLVIVLSFFGIRTLFRWFFG